MTASRYLPSAEYFSPLSKYFCLRTLGSREQPVNRAAIRQQESNNRIAIERRIIWILPQGTRRHAKTRANSCTTHDTASTISPNSYGSHYLHWQDRSRITTSARNVSL